MFGPVVAWVIVIAAGIPAVAVGTAMLRGVRLFRSFLITAGVLLAVVLLLFMTDLNLLVMLAYIPYIVFRLLTGAEIGIYVDSLIQSQWIIAHQLLCLAGGFLWLAATVSYARRSSDACLYCGRQDSPEGWTSPDQAARWGRIAVYVAMVVPVIYAVTRYAWVLGIPLGMSEESLRNGQESGMWISGLFLANFGLVGAVLTLGLVQRWGEVFPRWMIGLAGRRVPIALAVVPASLVSVLFVVGGIGIWSGLGLMVTNLVASGAKGGSHRRHNFRGRPHLALTGLGCSAGGGNFGLLLPAARPMQCVWSWHIRTKLVSLYSASMYNIFRLEFR